MSVCHVLVQSTWYSHLLKSNDWSIMYSMQFYLLICADLKLGLSHKEEHRVTVLENIALGKSVMRNFTICTVLVLELSVEGG